MAVTMKRKDLALMLVSFTSRMDEGSDQYGRFCDIVLKMVCAVDKDGNLTEDYRTSPMWEGGDDGTPLRPSKKAMDDVMLAAYAQGIADWMRK